MPMTVRWHPDEPGILLWEVGDRFSMDEFYATLAEVRRMLDETQPELYCIVTDMSHTRHYPTGLVTGFRQGHRRAGEEYRGTIMVGAPSFVSGFVTMINRLNIGSGKYRFVDSVEEAIVIARTMTKATESL